MAAEIEAELGVTAELVVGSPGEFTIWVDGRIVAQKERAQFPAPETVVDAIRSAVGR